MDYQYHGSVFHAICLTVAFILFILIWLMLLLLLMGMFHIHFMFK